MKIKQGFRLRQICGENIIVAEGKENIDFSKIISLNDTAAYIWEQLAGRDFTDDNVADIICQEYDIDRQTATKDAKQLCQKWNEIGLTE